MCKNRLASIFISSLIALGICIALPKNVLAYQQQLPHKTPSAISPHAATPGAHSVIETYLVVSVGDEFQVVAKSGLSALKKKIEDEYKLEMKAYQEAKKDKKNHDAATLKAPVKKIVKPLSKTFKTQEDAQKFVDEKNKEQKGGGKKSTINY